MPTYEYKCIECGYLFEEFQRITEEPLKICPKCSGSLKRLIGAGAGPIFKGSGFYHTDYKLKSAAQGSQISSTKSESKSGTVKSDKK